MAATPMIPQHYPIEPGILFGGEYPAHKNPEIAQARLKSLIQIGIRTFIDLTSPDDGLSLYQETLNSLAAASGLPLRRVSMPIPDMGIPTTETMHAILQVIRESVEQHPAVYVHCWGGIGRTGTVAGCWLRECGHDPESALARVQARYSQHMQKAKSGQYPHAPQTDTQRNYIKHWNPTD